MKIEDAIKEMRKFEKCHYEKPNGDADLKVYEALRLAIKALERQIPMGDDNTFECPKCHMVEFGYLRPRYCDDCGQRIAGWSDEEDE